MKTIFFSRLAIALNRIEKMFLIPWHPLYSLRLIGRIKRVLFKLTQDNQYDMIVTILNPFEYSIAACRNIKFFPNTKVVVYAVDTLRNRNINGNKAFASGYFWEKRIMKLCTRYFYMKSRRGELSLPRYNQFREKFVEVDLPRLKIKKSQKFIKYEFGTEGENWVYAGSLGGFHYNPIDMIDIFSRISSNSKINLHMYVRGGESNYIKKISQERKLSIYVHDYVDQGTLQRIMLSADILVTLKTSNQISAKIFECMSYLKPIVHFSGVIDDLNSIYYSKSNLYFVFKMYEKDQKKEIKRLLTWLSNTKNICITREQVEKIYFESTPEYSVKRILENVS